MTIADLTRMKSFLCFCSVVAGASFLAACDGAISETDVIAAQCAEPPPAAVTTRTGEILRLDVVQLGERFRQEPATFGDLGMNLDGRCSSSQDETTFTCARVSGDPRTNHVDGDAGIDNTFGRVLVPMLSLLDERPSEAASGTSFLALEGEGRATLHIGGRSGQIIVSIPLRNVRLDDTRLDALVTLAGVIPRAELVENVRARANALMEPPTTDLCSGTTRDWLIDAIQHSTDTLVSGAVDRNAECDGISIGLRFRASPATSVPALPPTCDEQIAKDAGSD
jgi:hypothetical protein